MTLPSSGPFWFSDIKNEIGSDRNSMDDPIIRALAGSSPGSPISASDFYGKTGKFVGNVSTDGNSISNGGISFHLYMNSYLAEIVRNATTGNVEVHFNSNPPSWTGNMTVTNNTTGVSSVLTQQSSINWVGPNWSNLVIRPNANDYFTIIPS